MGPERWLDGSISDDTVASYFNPFGNGVRHCIGKNLALLEARIALHALVARYSFAETDPSAFVLVLLPALAPKQGLRITVSKRKSSDLAARNECHVSKRQ